MDIKQILIESIQKSHQIKISSPRLDTEILLSHVLKKPREFLFAHPEKQLTKTQISSFRFQVSRRIKSEPIAYITGHKEFYGLDFYVNKNVLIPRPETELIVNEALRITRNMELITFIDIGTGSGCIIITLAKLLKSKAGYPISDIRYLATDISKPALFIARKNAKLHNVHKKIKFLHGNLLEPIINKSKILNLKSKIIITANLPYLTPAQIKNSPSIQYEPKLALAAGQDGLKYYRQLFKQIKQFIIYNCRFTILIEIDPSQAIKIKQLARHSFSKHKVRFNLKTKKDLKGHDRLVIISI